MTELTGFIFWCLPSILLAQRCPTQFGIAIRQDLCPRLDRNPKLNLPITAAELQLAQANLLCPAHPVTLLKVVHAAHVKDVLGMPGSGAKRVFISESHETSTQDHFFKTREGSHFACYRQTHIDRQSEETEVLIPNQRTKKIPRKRL